MDSFRRRVVEEFFRLRRRAGQKGKVKVVVMELVERHNISKRSIYYWVRAYRIK